MPDDKVSRKGEGEKRSYFRVDDIISVVANPLHIESEKSEEFIKNVSSSRIFPLMGASGPSEDRAEDNIPLNLENKKLYEMIAEVRAKLDFVINHLMLDKEGLLQSEKKLVNISASGVRFTVNHPVKVKDIMEIKLLLPTYPPVAVFAYGEVTRVNKLDDETYEVAIKYLNMTDSVKNEIIQYTLSHQRDTIRKLKEMGEDE